MLKRYGIVVVGILILAAIAVGTWTLSQRKTSRYSPVPTGVGIITDQEDTPSAEEPKAVEPEDESKAPALPFEQAPIKPAATEAQWKAIAGDEIWSVAWSPDGKRIAFVTVDETGDEEAVEGRIISRAVVWLMENPGSSDVQFRRLTQRTMKQGLPIGLFWLSNEEIGWATTAGEKMESHLCAARLSDGRVRQMTKRRIDLHYTEHAGSEFYDGPRDMYFDGVSGCLFLVGEMWGTEQDSPPIGIARYDPADDSLDMRRTSLRGCADICTFTGSDGKTSVYLCGYQESPDEAKPYEWPKVSKIKGGVPQGSFIRVSPNGKTISWLGWRDRGHALVLYDLGTKTAKEVALFQTFNWMEPRGCPYSWSPDGKKIAYSDGSRIKIVQVDSE